MDRRKKEIKRETKRKIKELKKQRKKKFNFLILLIPIILILGITISKLQLVQH